MKRLFIILLLVLCPWVHSDLWAQIYSTSSGKHHSYSNGGGVMTPAPHVFRSTSTYGFLSNRDRSYSTAPMQVANGSISTVASTIKGGVLLENANPNYNSESTDSPEYVIPGVPDTPIGEGWDLLLLLAMLCTIYVVRVTYKRKKDEC